MSAYTLMKKVIWRHMLELNMKISYYSSIPLKLMLKMF